MHILALEPYYDGSHKAFLDGWRSHSQHAWTLLTLPGYTWKWRMRHAAMTFADRLGQSPPMPQPQILFCSDMLNLAEFIGLAPAWVQDYRRVLYFHENQLTYPVRVERERDYQYAMTNLTSALSAHEVWFNSNFHQEELLSAFTRFLKRMPDYQSLDAIDRIRTKSRIAYPGINPITAKSRPQDGPLHILWAARWEHDKNPEDFFVAIDQLSQRTQDFRISVIGQSFQEAPPIFAAAKKQYQDKIIHWGYQPSRQAYENVLSEADVVVSTANHEFFGIGMVEAMAAGAIPLLPKRLAYPEILSLNKDQNTEQYLYDGSPSALAERLFTWIQHKQAGLLPPPLTETIQSFFWSTQAQQLDKALNNN